MENRKEEKKRKKLTLGVDAQEEHDSNSKTDELTF